MKSSTNGLVLFPLSEHLQFLVMIDCGNYSCVCSILQKEFTYFDLRCVLEVLAWNEWLVVFTYKTGILQKDIRKQGKHIAFPIADCKFQMKTLLVFPSGYRYKIFWRELFELSRQQISIANSSETHTHPFQEKTYLHSMNAKIRFNAVSSANNLIKESADWRLCWKCQYTDGIASAVECVQLFTDKSQISVRTESIILHSLHIALRNASNEF